MTIREKIKQIGEAAELAKDVIELNKILLEGRKKCKDLPDKEQEECLKPYLERLKPLEEKAKRLGMKIEEEEKTTT